MPRKALNPPKKSQKNYKSKLAVRGLYKMI